MPTTHLVGSRQKHISEMCRRFSSRMKSKGSVLLRRAIHVTELHTGSKGGRSGIPVPYRSNHTKGAKQGGVAYHLLYRHITCT
jgi:hypothetical protein